MDTEIQQMRVASEAAKMAAENAANAAKEAAKVATESSVNAAVVNTTLKYIQSDIKEIKETLKEQSLTTVNRYEFSEQIKIIDDNSKDIEKLKYKNYYYTGALAVIGIVSALVVYIYFYQQNNQDAQIDKILNMLQK